MCYKIYLIIIKSVKISENDTSTYFITRC